ncbi:MAG: SLBB domain-containing protein, partial [Anaerolineaceae bacterium]|nr:SLBB domain-containing protein [Anaerolineaceae bacterium]
MKNWHILLLGIFLGLLSAGLILLITMPQRGKPITIQNPALDTSLTPGVVMVHIAGEVNNPGIWSLPTGSRVSDGILAAGGMTDIADPNR